MFVIRNLLLFFLVFFCSTGWSLTLSDALSYVASHPSVVVQKLEINRSQASARDVGKRGPDQISVEFENVSGKFTGFSQAETTLSVSRPLLDRRKVKIGEKFAKNRIQLASGDLEKLTWEISIAIQTKFHEALILKALIGVSEEAETIALNLLEIAKFRAEAGVAPESEILRAELELNQGRMASGKLKGQFEQAMASLFREMGAEKVTDSSLEGKLLPDLSIPEMEKLVAIAVSGNPELKILSINEEASQISGSKLRIENRPEYRMGAGIRDFREEGNHGMVFGIEVDLPNPRSNAGERRALEIDSEKVRAEREKFIREIKVSLQEAYSRYNSSKKIVLDLRDLILPSSNQLLETALEAYKLGKADQLMVLQAEKAVVENRREYFNSLGDLYSAIDTMEKLCGTCLVAEKH